MCKKRALIQLIIATLTLTASAQTNIGATTGDGTELCAGDTVRYRITAIGGGASGDFAPYMLGSWNHGKTAMAGTALTDVCAKKDADRAKRFSWGAGVELLAGFQSKANYSRYIPTAGSTWQHPEGRWETHRSGPAAIWLQQLYATVKWRSVFLTAGMRERGSKLVDNALSSGDLVHSNNARPIAQLRAGFVDFQNIPFTNGWAQVSGCTAYGITTQDKYLKDHYNYWNDHIATGNWYVYRNLYLRSNPAKPLSVMIGIQASSFFAGSTEYYYNGVLLRTEKHEHSLKTCLKMFFPSSGDNWYLGSTLGSLDMRARWRTPDGGHEWSCYFQWLWEDGSGLAKQNKLDGLWGIQYTRRNGKHPLQSAVIEYIGLYDQSGPLHWSPDDHPGTTITGNATGGDDYYNNYSYAAYANYGMSLGTPFLVSPLYNHNGALSFTCSRSRGFHAAATGWLSTDWQWRAAVSHAAGYGRGMYTLPRTLHNTSAMAQVQWDARSIAPGLNASAALSFDKGDLRGDNFGALISISYTGNLLTFR